MITIDESGLSCPIPVVDTKRALKEHPEGLEVIVDNVAARENVTRYARAAGYRVDVTSRDGQWTLTVKK